MMTVFVFGTHPVKVSKKTAIKRRVYDVLKDKYVYIKGGNEVRVKKKKKVAKVHPVEKNPRVRFSYPQSKNWLKSQIREVRVIGANEKYVIGLEISDKNRFKKFLKTKMSHFELLEFSPESVS